MRRLALILVFFLLSGWMSIHAADRFAVVAFHDVVDFRGDLDDDAFTVDRLIGFFEWLRANHWKVLSLDDIEAARSGKIQLPKRSILITFDDGYRSLYTRVFPLAMAYQYPVVAALVGSWVDGPPGSRVSYGGKQVSRERFVSWDEAREMARSGWIEFASHSYNLHQEVLANPQGNQTAAAKTRAYAAGRGYETEPEFRSRIAKDIARAKEQLLQELGQAPRAIIWPYGRYNGPAVDEARKAGFQYAFTLDPEVLWTGNETEFNERLGHALERLKTLGATDLVLDAAVLNASGQIEATWFPNRRLPVRADLLSRISWQCQTRAGVKVFLRLPSSAALATLGSAEKVRALFDDLGAYVPASGLLVDDVPELAQIQGTHLGRPWEVQSARNAALNQTHFSRPARLALSAFKAVEFHRPGLLLAVVGPPEPSTGPSGLADLTLVPVQPNPKTVTRLDERLRELGWFNPVAARRTGLWFVGGDRPPTVFSITGCANATNPCPITPRDWPPTRLYPSCSPATTRKPMPKKPCRCLQPLNTRISRSSQSMTAPLIGPQKSWTRSPFASPSSEWCIWPRTGENRPL